MEDKKKYRRIARVALFIVAVVILISFLLYNIGGVFDFIVRLLRVLKPFAYGFIIAYFIRPIASFFRNRVYRRKNKPSGRISGALALTTAYIVAFGFAAFVIFVMIPEIYRELYSFVEKIVSRSEELKALMNSVVDGMKGILGENIELASFEDAVNQITEKAANLIVDLNNGVIPFVLSVVRGVAVELWNIFLGVVISVYVLSSGRRFTAGLKKLVFALFSEKWAKRIVEVSKVAHENIGLYLYSQFADSVIVGISFYLFMIVFKIEFAVFFAVFLAVANMIPLFGPIISCLCVFTAILTINPVDALIFAALFILINVVNNRIIRKYMRERNLGLTAFWVIFAVILAAGYFGVWGAFLGVPVFSVLFYCAEYWINNSLKKKKVKRKDLI